MCSLTLLTYLTYSTYLPGSNDRVRITYQQAIPSQLSKPAIQASDSIHPILILASPSKSKQASHTSPAQPAASGLSSHRASKKHVSNSIKPVLLFSKTME
jgi:hypothetical protein